MVERFLLNRINAESTGTTVGGQDDLVVLTGADKTDATLAFLQLAVPWARIALHPPIRQLVPVFRRHDGDDISHNTSAIYCGHARESIARHRTERTTSFFIAMTAFDYSEYKKC